MKAKSSDSIRIRGLKVWGRHGVYLAEKTLGQWFLIDLVLHTDLSQAGQSDALTDTIDYTAVIALTQAIVGSDEPKALLECVAEQLAAALLAQFAPLNQVRVRVSKLNPPIPELGVAIAVTLVRQRSDR